MLYKERKTALQKVMAQRGIKAVVLSPSANMSYLTGFSTFPGERLLVSMHMDSGEVIFVVPKMYEQEVTEKGEFDQLYAWDDSQNPAEHLSRLKEQFGLKDCTIAVEDSMYFSIFNRMAKVLDKVEYVNASEIVGALRACKTKAEADAMRQAGHLADTAIAALVKLIKAGMTETEVKTILEKEMKNLGATAPSFDTIIGSGSNSALPHYTAGERVLQDGDSVVVDFGALFKGYCSDMTRTLHIGKADEEFKKVYNIVKGAQQKAIEAVKPGIMACEVDAAARGYMEQFGYAQYFIHRTGHGIGMEVHEPPYITDSNTLKLQPGMTFSIEPGIYLPGKFGVRIEDIVMVTEDGVEVLNKFSKELIEI